MTKPRTSFGHLLNTQEAAEVTRRSAASIRRAIKTGALKAVPVKVPLMKPQWGIDMLDLRAVYPPEVREPNRRARLRNWRITTPEEEAEAKQIARKLFGPSSPDPEEVDQWEAAADHIAAQLRRPNR